MSLSRKDILRQLDECADNFTFPILDNGYVYLVSSRLSAYRDSKNWVILIEVIGCGNHGGGHKEISNGLYFFGNCLSFEPGINNANFLYFTDDSEDGPTFLDEEFQDCLNPRTRSILIRGKKVGIPLDTRFYELHNISLEEPPKVYIWEFLRGIRKYHGDAFFAREKEIKSRIPQDLPLILRLDEWYHNDLAAGELPSQVETFQMIASVIEKGNTELYQPTKKPNTHWSNWPEGGIL